MNRIILSRKGFDSSAGGAASPILNNKDIFSIPIPWKYKTNQRYKDVIIQKKHASELLKITKTKVTPESYCHLDPDLSKDRGLFGQHNAAQTELCNAGVGVGDLFLFFGWFKNYYEKIDMHHIFGWLQVGQILVGDESIKKFLAKKGFSHPHGQFQKNEQSKNNTLYIGSNDLIINDDRYSKMGYGFFSKSRKDLILTENGKSRSHWKLPTKYFGNAEHLFINRLSWLDSEKCTLQCKGQGQEYILDVKKNKRVKDWAINLILNEHSS